MFSFKNNYISGILSSVLSKYIEEIKPGELNVSLFAGQTQLKNLTLKSDALTSLKLPFTVIKGTVGSININCSVCSMLFYPFTLEISDVYVLASVNSSVMYEQNESCISKMVVKQESSKIVNYVTEKAINIAAGVKYVLKNVHIRLDHDFSEGYCSGGLFIPLIESCSPSPFLELFARGDRPGWDMWGNEATEDYEPTWNTYANHTVATKIDP